MTLEELNRLRSVDAALASRDGLRVAILAEAHNVSPKTIRRDKALLAAAVGPTVCKQRPADNAPGRTWVHWYADRRRRLFAKGR